MIKFLIYLRMLRVINYKPIFADSTMTYIQLAKVWINDKDAGTHKAFRYWRMIKGY